MLVLQMVDKLRAEIASMIGLTNKLETDLVSANDEIAMLKIKLEQYQPVTLRQDVMRYFEDQMEAIENTSDMWARVAKLKALALTLAYRAATAVDQPGATVTDDNVSPLRAEIDMLMAQLVEVDARITKLEPRTLAVNFPEEPILGSDAEWYTGFSAGAKGMLVECKLAVARDCAAAGITLVNGGK